MYVANNSYQFYIAGHFHYLNTVMEPQPSLASGKNVYVVVRKLRVLDVGNAAQYLPNDQK